MGEGTVSIMPLDEALFQQGKNRTVNIAPQANLRLQNHGFRNINFNKQAGERSPEKTKEYPLLRKLKCVHIEKHDFLLRFATACALRNGDKVSYCCFTWLRLPILKSPGALQ